jgi:hypothetical protein
VQSSDRQINQNPGLSKISQYVLVALLLVFGAVSVPVKACVDSASVEAAQIAAAPSDIR